MATFPGVGNSWYSSAARRSSARLSTGALSDSVLILVSSKRSAAAEPRGIGANCRPSGWPPTRSAAHQRFDLVRPHRHVARDQLAARGRDDRIVLDADADVVELLRHAFARAHVD